MNTGIVRPGFAITVLSVLAFLVSSRLGIGFLTPVILAFVVALALSLALPASHSVDQAICSAGTALERVVASRSRRTAFGTARLQQTDANY